MKKILIILSLSSSFYAKAQKIESISFNLYTDSLKKGVYNYINVDAKLVNGTYQPLTSIEITFTSTAGKWNGNSLIIDSAFKQDSVEITAFLKEHPEIEKKVTIFLKKITTEPALKTERELLDEWRNKKPRKN